MLKDPLLRIEGEKSQALNGNRTHDLSDSRHVVYHCAATASQKNLNSIPVINFANPNVLVVKIVSMQGLSVKLAVGFRGSRRETLVTNELLILVISGHLAALKWKS